MHYDPPTAVAFARRQTERCSFAVSLSTDPHDVAHSSRVQLTFAPHVSGLVVGVENATQRFFGSASHLAPLGHAKILEVDFGFAVEKIDARLLRPAPNDRPRTPSKAPRLSNDAP